MNIEKEEIIIIEILKRIDDNWFEAKFSTKMTDNPILLTMI